MRKIIVFIFFFGSLSVGVFAQTAVIAHRGLSSVAPENTLISFSKAIEFNSNYIEFDLHRTKDDSIVVIHDSSIDRTASDGVTGKIDKMTYAELQKVDISLPALYSTKYKGAKIPTFREVLGLAKGKTKVCVELKAYGTEEDVIKILKQYNMMDDAIIFSFHYQSLAKIRKLDSKIPTLLLINSINKLTIDYAKVIDVNYIGVGYGTKVTESLINEVHANKMKLFKWTVNTEKQMKQLVNLKVDGIITNYADKALEIVKNPNKEILQVVEKSTVDDVTKLDMSHFSKKYYHLKSIYEMLPNNRREIVFLGNSITQRGPWMELFQNKHIVNRGISGDTTDGIIYRLSEVTESHPKKVFLLVGVNDIAYKKTPKYIVDKIELIINTIKKDSPKTTIYLESILPTYGRKERPNSTIKEINIGLEKLASKKEIKFLNIYPSFVDNKTQELNKKYSLDGLHMNGDGYAMWKNLINKHVN